MSIGCLTHSYRYLILYTLQLRPLFPNNDITLRPKVDIGPNIVKSWLDELFMEKINYFWKNKTIFGKEKAQETLSVCMHTRVCTCTHAYAHEHSKHAYIYLGYAHAFRVLETMKWKLLHINKHTPSMRTHLGF